MRSDLTDITLVIDRSGSMQAIKDDAEGGINSFIQHQGELPGEALLTMIEFDTRYEFVTQGTPIQKASPYQLVPRGGTALLDAIGRAINETGQRISNLPESDRPGLVVFVVMTDGQENSSREFTRANIKQMIEHQQSKYNWQFTFLGADQDAFAEATKMGMAAGAGASFAKSKIRRAYAHTSSKLGRMREAASAKQEVVNEFTEAELDDMK